MAIRRLPPGTIVTLEDRHGIHAGLVVAMWQPSAPSHLVIWTQGKIGSLESRITISNFGLVSTPDTRSSLKIAHDLTGCYDENGRCIAESTAAEEGTG